MVWAARTLALVLMGAGGMGCGGEPDPATARCQAPAGVSAAPGSVMEMLALVNALPPPVTLTCVLESLERPLHVSAVNSFISLQPAKGSRSPRLFLSSGKLVSSVVPDGSGRDLMEFGEFVDETRTLKAELHFPVAGPLGPEEPFRRIRDSQGREGTTCRFCHADEQPAEQIDYATAYVSSALRPGPSTLIDLQAVREQHRTCDPQAEPERCAFFRALFDHGEVRPWQFPEILPTLVR